MMEEPTLLFAQNLKKIREEKKLSLDRLSELTGVSKSMLGQIERGESSPTISTIWKISNGLKVSFTSLLSEPQTDTALVQRANIMPLVEAGGHYRLYPLFPAEPGRRFELYLIEIDPGCIMSADPHHPGTQEFITVIAGNVIVRTNGCEYHVPAGDSIRFRADRPHVYENPGSAIAQLHLVIHYQG